MLLNGNADGSAGGAVGDIDPQVVEQVIQVRTGQQLEGFVGAGYRLYVVGRPILQRWHRSAVK
jgi:hypothetical protein